ncbi:MAG: hypothetical protein WBC01_11950 [Solirubrobacterales bacterium]
MGSAIRLIASAVGGLAILAGWLVALDYAFDGAQTTENRLAATLGVLLAGALALLAIRWTVLQAERDRPGSAQIGLGEVLITGGFMLVVVISIQEEAGAPAVSVVAAGFAGYWAWRVRLARTADSRAFDPGNARAPTVEDILDRLQLIAKAAPIPLTNNQVRIPHRRLDGLAGELRAATKAQGLNDAADAQAMELSELLEGAHKIPGTDDVRIDSDELAERIRMLRAELGLLDRARPQKDGPGLGCGAR